ncbi:hypothetical protein [Magpiepox virus 2]|nr:hypothetical protein [Magpiepox virus 2]
MICKIDFTYKNCVHKKRINADNISMFDKFDKFSKNFFCNS